jgi:hypothetical protein
MVSDISKSHFDSFGPSEHADLIVSGQTGYPGRQQAGILPHASPTSYHNKEINQYRRDGPQCAAAPNLIY